MRERIDKTRSMWKGRWKGADGESDPGVISKREARVGKDGYSHLRIKKVMWGGKESSAIKGNCCFYRGPELGSQHTHGGSHPPITLVSRRPDISSGLCGHWHAHGTYTY